MEEKDYVNDYYHQPEEKGILEELASTLNEEQLVLLNRYIGLIDDNHAAKLEHLLECMGEDQKKTIDEAIKILNRVYIPFS